MNGSTNQSTRINPSRAGMDHQRHDFRNEIWAGTSASWGANWRRPAKVSDVGGMFVVSGVGFNELSFCRAVRSLYHLYAIALRIVLNFVHDVVDEQHAAAGRLEKIRRVARIGNGLHVKAFAFIFDCEARFLRRQLGADAHKFGG